MSFVYINLYSQGTDCETASPFCTDNPTYVFPASTDIDDMGQVGCLYSTPNPAFYWMQISNPGNINIHISSDDDVDFICWGPFTSISSACASNLMMNSGVDCSFSINSEEDCNIIGAETGQVYVLLITNYANIETNISFEQTSGTASTNCSIIAPPINNDTICVGTPTTINVSSPILGAIYTWDGPFGFYQNSSNPNIIVDPDVYNTPGLYNYSLTVTVGGNTSSPVSCSILVNPIPISTTNTTICQNNTPYHWNSLICSQTGIYSDTLISSNGCDSITILNLTVLSSETPIFLQNLNFCEHTTPPVLPLISNNGIDGTWFPSIVNDSISSMYVFTPNSICYNSTHIDIIVYPNPIVITSSDTMCSGDTIMLSTDFFMSSIDTLSYTTNTPISPTSSENIIVTGMNIYGCIGIDTAYILVNPKPVAEFTTLNFSIMFGESVEFIDLSSNANSVLWNFGDGSYSVDRNPIKKYNIGDFQVWQITTSEFGCKDSINKHVTINLNYDCFIPNTFTPDHNGLNEMFSPTVNKSVILNYNIEIYDRWGSLVFKTNNIYYEWSGLNGNIIYPIGVYTYVIEIETIDLKKHLYIGEISLVR